MFISLFVYLRICLVNFCYLLSLASSLKLLLTLFCTVEKPILYFPCSETVQFLQNDSQISFILRSMHCLKRLNGDFIFNLNLNKKFKKRYYGGTKWHSSGIWFTL